MQEELTPLLLGQRLRSRRLAQRYSIRQIGAVTGVKHQTICDIEHGKRWCRMPQLIKIAEALGCSPTIFLRRVGTFEGEAG